MAYFRNSCQLDNLTLRFKWAFLHQNPMWELNWYTPFTLVWMVQRGERDILIDNVTVRARPGDIVVLEPNRYIRIVAEEDQPFDYYAIGFEAKIEKIGFNDMYRYPHHATREQLGDTTRLVEYWNELIRQSDHFASVMNCNGVVVSQERAGWTNSTNEISLNLQESLLFLQIQQSLYAWFAEFCQLILPQLSVDPIPYDARIQAICNYIHDHIHQKLTLKQIADHFFISPSHLSFLFRKTVRQSPMEYVRRIRMRNVCGLLTRSSQPIREIAEQFGYQNHSEFSRTFRLQFGMTPANYRKRFKRAMEVSINEQMRQR